MGRAWGFKSGKDIDDCEYPQQRLEQVSGGGLAHQGHTPSTSGSRPSRCVFRALSSANVRNRMVATVRAVGERDMMRMPTRSRSSPERGAQSISQLEIVTARLSDVDQLDDDSPAASTAPSTPFAE